VTGLSKENIKNISSSAGIVLPADKLFELPEKVLQFGTGVLLRGLPDYFIDKANRQGIFNGRVVMVKSTSVGGMEAYAQQDNLYTICVRGNEAGKKVEETIINSSISRVLNANKEWQQVLDCAHNPEIQIIISNTTEVGIVLLEDDIHATPPHSFPGKLLAFLYERYTAFNGANERGMVIIPTELIPGNGSKLLSIVLELARMNKLDAAFIGWIESANHFCNSLVDRIVPGKLTGDDQTSIEKKVGYVDGLAIMAESFRLWAIESADPRVKAILSFREADEGVVIADNIEKFRELKLRLLNGTHTFSCGLAFLAGFEMVKEGMADREMSFFIQNLAKQEIAVAMNDSMISYEEAIAYADKVLDRFRNPYIDHPWLNITLQYSSKMKMRNIPLLEKHYSKTNQPPEYMALGFAAFILFMKCNKNEQGQFTGHANLADYLVQDDHAGYFSGMWQYHGEAHVVETVLADKDFWGLDLAQLNGFSDRVNMQLHSLLHNGAMATIRSMYLKKMTI
jgi:tagaturonate reductase